MPVPIVLLVFLSVGTLAGIGFFLKSLTLQDQVARFEAENGQFSELQTLRMSNEWLKNRVATLQEEKAILLDNYRIYPQQCRGRYPDPGKQQEQWRPVYKFACWDQG
jgi:hypothetical protein